MNYSIAAFCEHRDTHVHHVSHVCVKGTSADACDAALLAAMVRAVLELS